MQKKRKEKRVNVKVTIIYRLMAKIVIKFVVEELLIQMNYFFSLKKMNYFFKQVFKSQGFETKNRKIISNFTKKKNS